MDTSLPSPRFQSLSSTSVAMPFFNTTESHLFLAENNIPFLIEYDVASKLYKKLFHLHKKMANEDIYYLEHFQSEGKHPLDILYCGSNNKSPRIFIIDKEIVLGKGTQGVVHLGQELFKNKHSKNNSMVAVKVCKVNTVHKKEDFKNEIKILSLQGRFHGSFYDKKGMMGYMIQDLCHGKSFFDWCYKEVEYDKKTQQSIYERIPTTDLLKKRFVTAILKAYHELHQNYGILHRDIKPENIMISITDQDQIVVKIIDFSTSCLMQNSEKNFSGTPGYMPPETINEYANRPFASLQTEYWSIGVMCAAWLSENNYLNYLNKKMASAQTKTGFIPDCLQKDLYKALPDIFKKNDLSLPLLSKRNQSSTGSSSYSSSSSALLWEEYLNQCIFCLVQENVHLRPGYLDITKMLENLSLYEKNDKNLEDNLDLNLIEKINNIMISQKNKKNEASIIEIEDCDSDKDLEENKEKYKKNFISKK